MGHGEKLATGRKWEEGRAIGTSFGYNRNEALADYQTAGSLICLLVNLVSKGGNLCLDVGPTADGRIPVIMQQRLADLGNWLKINGEAIYGTHPWQVPGEGPTPPPKGRYDDRTQVFQPSDIRFTAKADTIYASCLAVPTAEVRIVSLRKSAGRLSKPIGRVKLLGSDESLQWSQQSEPLVIKCPRRMPTPYAACFKIDLCRDHRRELGHDASASTRSAPAPASFSLEPAR